MAQPTSGAQAGPLDKHKRRATDCFQARSKRVRIEGATDVAVDNFFDVLRQHLGETFYDEDIQQSISKAFDDSAIQDVVIRPLATLLDPLRKRCAGDRDMEDKLLSEVVHKFIGQFLQRVGNAFSGLLDPAVPARTNIIVSRGERVDIKLSLTPAARLGGGEDAVHIKREATSTPPPQSITQYASLPDSSMACVSQSLRTLAVTSNDNGERSNHEEHHYHKGADNHHAQFPTTDCVQHTTASKAPKSKSKSKAGNIEYPQQVSHPELRLVFWDTRTGIPTVPKAKFVSELHRMLGSELGPQNVKVIKLPVADRRGIVKEVIRAGTVNLANKAATQSAAGTTVAIGMQSYVLRGLTQDSYRYFLCQDVPIERRGRNQGQCREKALQNLASLLPQLNPDFVRLSKYRSNKRGSLLLALRVPQSITRISFQVPRKRGKTRTVSFYPLQEDRVVGCSVCRSPAHSTQSCRHFKSIPLPRAY